MKAYSLQLIIIVILAFPSTLFPQEKELKLSDPTMVFLDQLMKKNTSLSIDNPTTLFQIAMMDLFKGNNDRGNEIMDYAMSQMDSLTEEEYHAASVQNTKNGNYATAVEALEKAMLINPKEISGYYGWVMLYYYRDYKKALSLLEQYDSYTPNFSDAPVGEDIHYLKGLAHMQLKDFTAAIYEFDYYINELTQQGHPSYIDAYAFVQRGRCLAEQGKYSLSLNAFDKAILYDELCSEAYYYKGLVLHQMKKNNEACTAFHKAMELLQKGYKSGDPYIEFFHEIYPSQISLTIDENCMN